MSATALKQPTTTRTAPPPVPANQPSWILPEPGPSFEEIRLFRKQRLAASLRLFALYGFDYGPAGHITVRDPEWTDHFWINPMGTYFGHISVSDLLLVNHAGDIVIGHKSVNQAGFQIHSAIHRARQDIIGVAHSHSIYGKAWSTLGRPLAPLTQDSAVFYGQQAFSDFTGIVLDSGQAQKIVADLGDKNFAILKNHGFLTAAVSVESAVWWFIALEDAARAQLLAESAATPPIPLSPEVAHFTANQGNRNTDRGRYGFQPLYERITREQPDLLD
jgi:ribulose-5-phosphate 4-epimerase/fuculose-1-phosphate aldolase